MNAPRGLSLVAWVFVLAVLLGTLASMTQRGAALADEAETDFRLRAIKIEDPLRSRIRTGVDSGVRWLQKVQREDGSFISPRNSQWSPGVTPLSGLAARHAGTPEGCAVAAKTLAWMKTNKGAMKREIAGDVYFLSLAMMLQEACLPDVNAWDEGARILVESQSHANGWWGYFTVRSECAELAKSAFPKIVDDDANLSTSQFAALALWGTGRQRGARVTTAAWKRHVESLLANQGPAGSWAYEPGAGSEYKEYQCGTFMGIANLLLGVESMGGAQAIPEPLRERVASAVKRGRAALDRDGDAFLASIVGRVPLEAPSGTEPGHGAPYYELFALEKACIFAGKENVGARDWYQCGAETLLKAQNRDGGWGGRRERIGPRGPDGNWLVESDPVSTSLAVLFLVRAPEAFGIATPRPIDSRRLAIATDDTRYVPPKIDPMVADGLGERDLHDLFAMHFAYQGRRSDGKEGERHLVDFVAMGPRVLPLLINQLGSKEQVTRDLAFRILAKVTTGGPAFNAEASSDGREVQVAAWQEWWGQRRTKLKRDLVSVQFTSE